MTPFGEKLSSDIFPWTLSVSRSSQVMSVDKYPIIFSCQMEAIVYIITMANPMKTLELHYLAIQFLIKAVVP